MAGPYPPAPDDRSVGTANPPGDNNTNSDAIAIVQAVLAQMAGFPGNSSIPADNTANATALQTIVGTYTGPGLAPSGDMTGADDLTNINSLTSGPVLLQPGSFYTDGDITTSESKIKMVGWGYEVTEINCLSTTAHGFYTENQSSILLRDLTFTGPGDSDANTGDGVHLDTTGDTNVAYSFLENLRIQDFGANGVYMRQPIVCSVRDTEVSDVAGDAFQIIDGTSCSFATCYSHFVSGRGYFLSGLEYASLTGCACDGGEYSYVIQGCNNIKLDGCGAEAQTTGSYVIEGGSVGVVLDSCLCRSNPGIACHVTGDSTATIVGFQEIAPAGGATASIQVDAGSSATIIDPVLVTAPVYNGNVTVIENGVVTYWSGGSIVPYPFLCAPKQYAPASQTSVTVSSATLAAFASGTVATNSFTAPATGAVMVDLTAVMDISSSTASTMLALAETGTVTPVLGGGTATFQCAVGNTSFPVSTRFYVTGLTAGSAYTFDLLGAASSGDTATIFAFGGTALTVGSRGAPVIMTVQGA
jgi:hypothetical protein